MVERGRGAAGAAFVSKNFDWWLRDGFRLGKGRLEKKVVADKAFVPVSQQSVRAARGD